LIGTAAACVWRCTVRGCAERMAAIPGCLDQVGTHGTALSDSASAASHTQGKAPPIMRGPCPRSGGSTHACALRTIARHCNRAAGTQASLQVCWNRWHAATLGFNRKRSAALKGGLVVTHTATSHGLQQGRQQLVQCCRLMSSRHLAECP
jgi:hypothetical protein